MKLNVEANFTDPDAFYASLTDLHRTLDNQQSQSANARLILLLANHIGDLSVLEEALTIAREVE